MIKYTRSSALFTEARQYISGGVNSPVRAFKSVGGTPVFFKKAQGSYLTDEDNRVYVDFINSWGPMILGHAHPKVVEAIKKQADLGTSFGAPTAIETEIARLAVEMIGNIDLIRFVNSGTEACMSAVRLARGFTGREKIIKFAGCYHGHSDAFLIQAGSGAVTFGSPNSPGVTVGTAKDTLLAQYNHIESVRELIEANSGQIAAVIIEPVAGNMGCIPPKANFLETLRTLCNTHGILLIFDEVMTGFRLAKGGAQEKLDIKADIITYGKVIGGGMPVGAFAARKEIMDYLSPTGPVYQAGTLSGNPIAMAAGLAMLQSLDADPEIYVRLEEKGVYLENGIRMALKNKDIPFTINRLGSMISVHFTQTAVVDFETAALGNNNTFKKFFHFMLDQGFYLPPSAFESWFLSDALSYEDLNKTIEAVENFQP